MIYHAWYTSISLREWRYIGCISRSLHYYRSMFQCDTCKKTFSKWTGQCQNCGNWNTLKEFSEQESHGKLIGKGRVQVGSKIGGWEQTYESRIKSTSNELDDVLGWGMTPWSLILLSGEPWIWKSTLALQMAEWYGKWWKNILYVSGEENLGQISARAKRLWVSADSIDILTTNLFEDIVATIEIGTSDIVIIDSISVLSSNILEWVIGSIAQIRTMTELFMSLAKRLSKSILLIGHITKDGSISWPKSLEHLVDIVLFLEGSRSEEYRILRSFKNRFWSTDTVGLFRMTERGLVDLPNPGFEFIDKNHSILSGSALSFTIEGNRPLLIEIEALTAYTKFGYPKRSWRGIPIGKLDLLIAVVNTFTDLKLESYDVYLNIGRWIQASEPWIDLACIAAIMSSRSKTPLRKTIWLWEVSLTGVIKNISQLERRMNEAVKLGFSEVIIPEQYEGKIPWNLEVRRLRHIHDIKTIL